MEQIPPGIPPPPVQFAPPSVERRCPSSPQMSTIPWPVGPPGCTTTSHTSPAAVAGVGSTKVHVAPELVLIATPQFVPTNTLFAASGRMPIPNAEGSSRRAAEQLNPGLGAGGFADAGCVHVLPPSALTSMPESGVSRPSKNDVA